MFEIKIWCCCRYLATKPFFSNFEPSSITTGMYHLFYFKHQLSPWKNGAKHVVDSLGNTIRLDVSAKKKRRTVLFPNRLIIFFTTRVKKIPYSTPASISMNFRRSLSPEYIRGYRIRRPNKLACISAVLFVV